MAASRPFASEKWDADNVNARFTLGAGITGPDEMAWLVGSGITHVVSAAAELDDKLLCVPVLVTFYHLLWRDDGQAKPLEDLLDLLCWATTQDQQFTAARDVLPTYYIHCAAGVNRGPTVCTFLMSALGGGPTEETWKLIRAARPRARGYTVPAYRDTVDAALATIRTHVPMKENGDDNG